tara:strand:+ start:657 stop:995 length:339 start_codon:yes stop_codon:yes gene_type:complete
MSTHKIVTELLDENLIGAKKEIEDALYAKLGEKLTDAYKEIAPSILADELSENVDSETDKEDIEETLDPVGEEDDDIDNDGKKNTKTDKYLKNRRKKIGKALKSRSLGAGAH